MRRIWPRVLIALSILGAAHFYIWTRFVAAAELSPLPYAVATVLVIALAPSLPVATFALRDLPRHRARPLKFTAYAWFGFATYLFFYAMVTHIVVAVGLVDGPTGALIGVLAALATAGYGIWNVVGRGPVVKRTRIAVPGYTGAPYTIVQLTDVHIGWYLEREFAAAVVAKVNALAPDLIVITGDLVDGHLHELRRHVEPLRDLRAKDGVYSVTGNHEYYWNAGAWLEHLRSLGLRILRNQHVAIAGDRLTLAGTPDITADEDLAAALAGAPADKPIILLAHHPKTVLRAQDLVDLQLSGHTHGGQLLPLGYLSRLFEPHVSGLAKFGARTQLYVSEGTGFWGPPMRVGTRCEIAALVIEGR